MLQNASCPDRVSHDRVFRNWALRRCVGALLFALPSVSRRRKTASRYSVGGRSHLCLCPFGPGGYPPEGLQFGQTSCA